MMKLMLSAKSPQLARFNWKMVIQVPRMTAQIAAPMPDRITSVKFTFYNKLLLLSEGPGLHCQCILRSWIHLKVRYKCTTDTSTFELWPYVFDLFIVSWEPVYCGERRGHWWVHKINRMEMSWHESFICWKWMREKCPVVRIHDLSMLR